MPCDDYDHRHPPIYGAPASRPANDSGSDSVAGTVRPGPPGSRPRCAPGPPIPL